MNIQVGKGNLSEAKTQAIVLVLCEGERQLSGTALDVDRNAGGLISDVLSTGDFEGKTSQISLIYTRGALKAPRIVLAGLGKRNEVDLDSIRHAYARAARYLCDIPVERVATAMDWTLLPQDGAGIVDAVVEGAILGAHRYAPFKTNDREKTEGVRKWVIVAGPGDDTRVRDRVRRSRIVAEAVCRVRDLVSAPANEMTPSTLAEQARKIADGRSLSCRVLEKRQLKTLGMNALLGVASGSRQPPKLILLSYAGGDKGEAPIVLVGKGVTFDSGGLSLKSREGMEEMKDDMAGGAVVLATLAAAADLRLPLNLVGLVPAAENLPGGEALKPGDVLKSLSGRTIEVVNTDAEGRLILADALTYAGRFKPRAVIDVATLTGACVVALGPEIIGLFGNDPALTARLRAAGDATGEAVWELPLWKNYEELIKSDVADLKNSSGREGAAITAALFLSRFVGPYPWAHLDIAGPVWRKKDSPGSPKGASGVGVRLLIRTLSDWESAAAPSG